METKLVIGKSSITIDEVYHAIVNNLKLELSEDREFLDKIKKSREILEIKLTNGENIYGVTTGYGDSCDVVISPQDRLEIQRKLTAYHRCGLGENFSEVEAKTIQLVRIISLSRGYSAVRPKLLEFMVELYNMGIIPRIPQEGSVGASGDLTPLAYYAATLIGEGEVFYQSKLHKTEELYKQLNIDPITLHAKEALALMNGTAVMTALACIAIKKASYICKLSSRITAMSSLALLANPSHFDEEIFKAKPHAGSMQSASWIREDLQSVASNKKFFRLQDRYSIRCAPHIIGVLLDAITSLRGLVEIELNSANDNPLIDSESEKVLHGGNFYGGHIAFVMDSLKVLIANTADLMDRQMALLVDSKFSNGLPPNLAYQKTGEVYNHGLKALQISTSAWTAECLKLTLAASIFSRSTECHNQDKVSMGTIAARDCLRCVKLTQQVLSALCLANYQALSFRLESKVLNNIEIGENILGFIHNVSDTVEILKSDRPLEIDLRKLCTLIDSEADGLIK